MSVSKPRCRLAEAYRVRALVVDDVEDNREVLSGLLERAGIEVSMASSGVEALQAIARRGDCVCCNHGIRPAAPAILLSGCGL